VCMAQKEQSGELQSCWRASHGESIARDTFPYRFLKGRRQVAYIECFLIAGVPYISTTLAMGAWSIGINRPVWDVNLSCRLAWRCAD